MQLQNVLIRLLCDKKICLKMVTVYQSKSKFDVILGNVPSVAYNERQIWDMKNGVCTQFHLYPFTCQSQLYYLLYVCVNERIYFDICQLFAGEWRY